MAKRKQYSEKERYDYHFDRFFHPENRKIGNKSPKRFYSEGFIDAFHGVNDSDSVRGWFGIKALFAYRQGQRIGHKADANYAKKNGQSLFKKK